MDEYVVVRYPARRGVRVDGRATGKTNNILTIERGTHKFDLGVPINYKPACCRVTIKDTSIAKPMEVIFEKA